MFFIYMILGILFILSTMESVADTDFQTPGTTPRLGAFSISGEIAILSDHMWSTTRSLVKISSDPAEPNE